MGLVLLASCAAGSQFTGYIESLDRYSQYYDFIEYDSIEAGLNDSLNVVLQHTDRTRQLLEWTNDDSFVWLFWNNSINLNLNQEEFNLLLINSLNK